jgi:hypothetical protein
VFTCADRPGIGERECRISFNTHTAGRRLAGLWPPAPLFWQTARYCATRARIASKQATGDLRSFAAAVGFPQAAVRVGAELAVAPDARRRHGKGDRRTGRMRRSAARSPAAATPLPCRARAGFCEVWYGKQIFVPPMTIQRTRNGLAETLVIVVPRAALDIFDNAGGEDTRDFCAVFRLTRGLQFRRAPECAACMPNVQQIPDVLTIGLLDKYRDQLPRLL